MSEKAIVGVLGAGMMGSGMVLCLLDAGHRVLLVPHRNRQAIERLLGQGGEEVGTPDELATKADVVLTCVTDAAAVEAIAEQILPALRTGTVWIDATTSDPAVTTAIAKEVFAAGAVFADAPVTGGPAQARSGELASLVGCRAEDFPEVEAIVGVYSKIVRRFGEVGAGHTGKLLNNLVTQGTMVLLAEAYGAARSVGVDWRALYEVMSAGAARSGTLEKAVSPALEGDFDGSRFTIRNSEKDLRYALKALQQFDIDVARAAHSAMKRHVELGRGDAFVSRLLQYGEYGADGS